MEPVAKPLLEIGFAGRVSVRREACGPLGLTLTGTARDRAGETVHVSFVCPPPADFPQTLADARVEQLDEKRYRISSGPRDWVVSAASAHVHREVAAVFHAAVPPRPAPWSKRLFWRAVLALAGTSLGRRLLRSR